VIVRLSYKKIIFSVITMTLSVVAFFVLNISGVNYYDYENNDIEYEISDYNYESKSEGIEACYTNTIWIVEIPAIGLIGPIHSRYNHRNNGQVCTDTLKKQAGGMEM